MKKRFFPILCAVLLAVLCACTVPEADPPAVSDPVDIPPVIEEPVIEVPAQPQYTGTLEGYEYFHTDERDRRWEEDVLSLAGNFLQYHPKLVNEEIYSYIGNLHKIDWTCHFDQTLHAEFLQAVNLLISEIPALSDTQILYRLQSIVASLHDVHSWMQLAGEPFFVPSFVPFYTDDGVEFRAVVMPAGHELLLYSRLISINGIPIEEILERARPYISYENERSFLNDVGNTWLRRRDFLEVLGVIEEGSDTAVFTLLAENGWTVSAEFRAITQDEYSKAEVLDRSPNSTYALLYQNQDIENYWHQMLPEDDALYIRISLFKQEEEQNFFQLSSQITEDVEAAGGVEKVIVDLRDNPGGQDIEGWDRFFQTLSHDTIGTVYVLINEVSFSRSVVTAFTIKSQVEGSVLVGTPAGEGALLFGIGNDSHQTLPNCGVEYCIGTNPYFVDPDGSYNALMPDILVCPDLADYKNSVDTALEYVLAQ